MTTEQLYKVMCRYRNVFYKNPDTKRWATHQVLRVGLGQSQIFNNRRVIKTVPNNEIFKEK